MDPQLIRAGIVGSCGVEFVVSVGLFTYLGKLGDSYWELGTTLTVSGMLFGFVVGIYAFMNTLKRLEKYDEELKRSKQESKDEKNSHDE